MHRIVLLIIFVICAFHSNAQSALRLKIVDGTNAQPLPAVTITVNGKNIAQSDSAGIATLNLADGRHRVDFSSSGYEPKEVLFTVPDSSLQVVEMIAQQKTLEDITVISSTRNNQRIENSPLKVEVLGREEMDEEIRLSPQILQVFWATSAVFKFSKAVR